MHPSHLNRIHEGSFDMVEVKDAEEEDDHRDGNTVKQVQRIDTAGAKGCVTH